MPPIFTARFIRASKYSASVLLSASSLAFPAAVADIFSFISSSARCRCNISATTVALGTPPGLEHEARASETIKGATAPALGGPLGLEQADSGISQGRRLARELFTFTALIKKTTGDTLPHIRRRVHRRITPMRGGPRKVGKSRGVCQRRILPGMPHTHRPPVRHARSYTLSSSR
eukprot:scaffold6760_cov119-Isochrysis_galbana.AAC.12